MIHRTWALGVLFLLLVCAPAWAAPATVNIRIEGSGSTVYEGPVTTDGKIVTTAAGGSHKCDGTNNAQPHSPGATPTTALDDSSIAHGFTWDGSYFASFDDFAVERIASDGQVGVFTGNFWDLIVNRVTASVGGCQMRVSAGDQVLWEWQDGSKPNLQLTAPAKAEVGQPVDVRVQEYGSDGALAPAAGASVNGQLTGADGHATVSFSDSGTHHFKATRPDAIRSNAVDVCVYTPGSGACDTVKAQPPAANAPAAKVDRVAPSAELLSPRNGARYHRGPRTLAGKASDDTGLLQVYFRLRRIAAGGCRWYNAKTDTFTHPRTCRHARFQRLGAKTAWSFLLPERLPPGRYILDEKALDTSFNAGRAQVRFRVLG
jgi:hypothetical protein